MNTAAVVMYIPAAGTLVTVPMGRRNWAKRLSTRFLLCKQFKVTGIVDELQVYKNLGQKVFSMKSKYSCAFKQHPSLFIPSIFSGFEKARHHLLFCVFGVVDMFELTESNIFRKLSFLKIALRLSWRKKFLYHQLTYWCLWVLICIE